MKPAFPNPALEWFVQWFVDELVIAQVRVRRQGTNFELRHVDDQHEPGEALKQATPEEAREIAQFTETGAFRPLKSAPTLRRGWRIVAGSNEELATALDRLYPGAIADLYATLKTPPPVTDYREFTGRQTGMYRITAFLNDPDAGAVVRKGCAKEFCLKRRFWDVQGFAPETPQDKSVVPCLEPCAILLEFVRKVVRGSQREGAAVEAVLPSIDPRPKGEDE